jgi:hypothetical protein
VSMFGLVSSFCSCSALVILQEGLAPLNNQGVPPILKNRDLKCCGCGSARIKNFFPDPAPDTELDLNL